MTTDATSWQLTWQPRFLSLLRFMAGLEILQHGTAVTFGFPVVPALANTQINSIGGVAGCIELIGGFLIVLGLFTRPVAFILAGFTAVAYFMVHVPKGFYPILNSGELVALYCFVFLYLIFAGPGPWSVDAAIRKS
jgi:putative oxidoreductase